jgi:hypothetical protein
MLSITDRSKKSDGTTPVSAVNDSGSENRLSELIRLVDKRKKMIQDRDKNARTESPFQVAKSDKITDRVQ